MKNHLIKAIAVLSIITTVSVAPLSNFASAAPVYPGEPQVQSSSYLTSDGNEVFKASAKSVTGTVEILEGTDQDWTKLKVVQGDRVDILERKTVDGIPTVVISNTEGDNHVVQTIDDQVLVDNEIVQSKEVNLPASKSNKTAANAVASTSTTWYVKDSISGSFNSDFAVLSILIGVITAFMSIPASIATTLAVGIYGYRIPYTWYNKLTLWDAAPYRPLHWITTTTYSDAAMTIQTGYDSYYI
ncbi:hypothetical protein [Paenibacillus sp. sgz500958]|uniref:hypothetical protein n=1 Tax=Paenibacillus sp. sgz500958 TaxID=3242475 RepID=UPI0036D25956